MYALKNTLRAIPAALGLVLGGAVLPAGGAAAATISYANSFSGTTDVTNQLISLQQFDSALGTLSSATFTLSGLMNTVLTVTHDASAFVGWDKTAYQLSLGGTGAYSGV